ncbi:MAG: nicotinamide mononucleotide transporter [Mycoplasmatales bacterium]|nr:nicotinamide mononucleotide transporter [Mycoplasmatales bacterium]
MKKINLIETIMLILLSLLLIVFSLYSVSYNSWIWESGGTWKRVLGTLSGLAAFTGILATFLFWKRNPHSLFAFINAILFGLFALSVNLTGDFLVNFFWIIPVLIFTNIRSKKSKMTIYRLTKYSITSLVCIFVIGFVFFIMVNPLMNNLWIKILKINDFTYGTNFKFYWGGRILDSLMNALTLVGMIMMVKGYKQTWYLWVIKNIVAILFFGGIAVIDVSILIMNISFLILMFFIIHAELKKKTLRVAIIGPGAIGKSTVIKYLKPFLEENNIQLFDEREGIITDQFSDYMNNMKKYAYEMQVGFFDKRISQLKKLCALDKGLMDRHSTDDFIFSRLHIEQKNFSQEQIKKWNKKEKRYWRTLQSLPKLDLLFILMGSDEVIESRRDNRSASEEFRETELKNKEFFKKANAMYHDPESIMYKAFEFSKEQIFIENIDSKQTSKKIISKIKKSSL